MLYRHADRRPFTQLLPEIDRLRRLVHDLERISRGEHPGAATLAKAPVIGDWRLARRAEACLVGTMRGHPKLADGAPGATSGLWVLAPELGYARTLSRFYALGDVGSNIGIGRRLT